MAQIFINYRRKGGAYAAALLDELLSLEFGEREVFRASRSIPAGVDFEESILLAIAECDVMLVVVDEGWFDRFNGAADGEKTSDWVSREIQEAVKRDGRVIPVLLSGVSREDFSRLPSELENLARLQYLRFDYRNIHQDAAFIAMQLSARRGKASLISRFRRTGWAASFNRARK